MRHGPENASSRFQGKNGTLISFILDRLLAKAVDWFVGIICAGLVVMVFSGVIARYVFNYSLSWSDELAGLCMVWLTMIGSVAAMRRKTHMAMGFFTRFFDSRGQRIVGYYVMGCITIFLVFMIKEGITLTQVMFSDRSPVLNMPIGLYYLSLPVGGSLMLIYALREIVSIWTEKSGWAVTVEESED